MYQVVRRDTLEFSINDNFKTSQNISRADVIESLKKSCGRENFKAIKCVQPSPNGNSYRISFKPGADMFRESLFAKGIFLKGLFLNLNEAEPSCTVVTVKSLPFELADDDVITFFRDYGEIKKIVRSLDTDGLETGDRRLFISLKYHIPHMVILEPYRAFVYYRGQPVSCYNCNFWGHTYGHCPLKRRCVRCGKESRNHRCDHPDVPIPMPEPVLVADKDTEHQEHPAVRLEALRIEMEENAESGSVSSTHTNDLFGPIEDIMADSEEQQPSSPNASHYQVLDEGVAPSAPMQNTVEQTPSPILLFSPAQCAVNQQAGSSTSFPKRGRTPTFEPSPPFPSVDMSVSPPSFSNILMQGKRGLPLDEGFKPVLTTLGRGRPRNKVTRKDPL